MGISERTIERVLAWAITSIALTMIVLGDLVLNFEVSGRSATAYMAIFALIIVAAGLTLQMATRLRFRPDGISSVFPERLGDGKWLLHLSGFSALLFITHQWIGSFSEIDDPTSLQRLVSQAILTAGVVFFASARIPREILIKSLLHAGLAGAVLVLIDKVLDFGFLGSRHSSMFFLIPLVLALCLTRFTIYQLVSSTVILSAIFSTESRTSTAVAILILLVSVVVVKETSLSRRILTLGVGLVTFALFLGFNSSFRTRFLNEPGDRAFVIPTPLTTNANEGDGAIFLNTNGRVEVWTAMFEEALRGAPLFGNGAGSAAKFVGAEFGWTHPHNEYLRILADHGALGLFFFVAALMLLSLYIFRHPGSSASDRFMGLGSIAVLTLLSVTDLPLVSLGVFLPAAIAIGASISADNLFSQGP